MGQNWSQPPWDPHALEEAAYAPFRDVVRATLRHAGALRIDHILGLFRLWWVPDGCSPDDGVYVRYDHEALVGILVLEAMRAGAVVIGEDLGTVEPWVSEYLASRGILGTVVMWFEKRGDGAPRAPEDYRPGVLASVTVHDLPPTAAYLAGEHVRLRESLGLLAGPVEEVRAEAERERAGLVRMLVEHGWLAPDAVEDQGEILIALHRALLASPCALVGVAVPDLVGDLRTQNQPGTNTEYPNWRVPLCDGRGTPIPLDTLFDHPRARALLEAIHNR
jgi:4-alpha-glucanotransferase